MKIQKGTIELKAFVDWLNSLPDEKLFWQGDPRVSYRTSPFAIYLMRKNKPPCRSCKAVPDKNVSATVDQWGYQTLNGRGHYGDYTIMPKWCRDIHVPIMEAETPIQV